VQLQQGVDQWRHGIMRGDIGGVGEVDETDGQLLL
jgi:hypothetical protein